MDKKGQALGGILLVFLGVIVVTALVPQIFGNQATMTQTYFENASYDVPATDGDSVDLRGQELIDTPLVINRTGAAVDCSLNYTIAEGVSPRTGVKRILLTRPTGNDEGYCGRVVNVSYTFGDEGYVDNAGGRGVAGLIGLFSVLALAAYVLYRWYADSGGLFNR